MTKITKRNFKEALEGSLGTNRDLSVRLNVSDSAISQFVDRHPDMKELQAQELRATQNAKPFARHAAREDFNKAIKVQVDDQVRKYGSVEKPEELKLPVVDWDKYSNLSNFDLTEEKNVADTNLSKHNPGLNVLVKTLVYKFKGYGQIYKVMESGPDAITRAIKTRAKLDQTINQDLEKPEVKPETQKTN